MLRIVLLTPHRGFIANRVGLGYQVPLGLVLIGGPLRDAGHHVRLIDNDVKDWDDERLAGVVAREAPDCIFIGHSASLAAHPAAMRTAHCLRERCPRAVLVYGGIYPSYAAERILAQHPAIDVVVRGEGEATALELASCLDCGTDLKNVLGISFRDGEQIFSNPVRPPIADLDRYRPGFELLNLDDYRLFGMRAVGMQFSRGCPNRCSYCAQWSFWRKHRHRSPERFVDELTHLSRDLGVRFVWLADENFAADREVARQVLELLVERKLELSLNLQMTAAEVVRDEDLIPLYKRAGVQNVLLGIESTDDAVLARVGKDNPFEVSRKALAVLRRNDIVTVTNLIYGLREETPSTLWRTLQGIGKLDPDILLTCFLTPYLWTREGRATKPGDVVQPDLARFTHRTPVLRAPRLGTWGLFGGVKLTEALFHLRPKGVWRLFFGGSPLTRAIRRTYFFAGVRAVRAELSEFIVHTRFAKPGTLAAIPGDPAWQGKASAGGGHVTVRTRVRPERWEAGVSDHPLDPNPHRPGRCAHPTPALR